MRFKAKQNIYPNKYEILYSIYTGNEASAVSLLLVYTHVYSMYTHVYPCIPTYTHVYPCIPMYTQADLQLMAHNYKQLIMIAHISVGTVYIPV